MDLSTIALWVVPVVFAITLHEAAHGYAALAFGAWDIFYYVFLRLISGWPRTLLDWDILFLLPLPWWGPVLAPVSIALVMILWGTLATQSDDAVSDAFAAWPERLCVADRGGRLTYIGGPGPFEFDPDAAAAALAELLA